MTATAALKAVLFDLDGTLLDTYPAHLAANIAMFRRFGIDFDEATFQATYSPNWYATFEAMNLPPEQWQQANAWWLEAAAQHRPAAFPGVAELLATLERRFLLGLVTAGNRSRVERDLGNAGLAGRFRVMISGDEVTRRKPDPQGLELALAALDVAPGQALYVGDAAADREMAHRAGVRFIGVPSRFDALGEGCETVAAVCELERLLKSASTDDADFADF